MATRVQSFIDRENITNPVLKNSVSKGLQAGQRKLPAKTFKDNRPPQATPRKALGDLGNLQQYGTGKKIQSSVKPSKVKIFEDLSKTNPRKNKVKTKQVFSDNSENSYLEIENMVPFVDQENDLPTPQCIKKLLQHPRLFKPSLLVPPRRYTTDDKGPRIFSSVYDLDADTKPDFDDTMANIIGYDDKLEFTLADESLPCLDDIPFDVPLF